MKSLLSLLLLLALSVVVVQCSPFLPSEAAAIGLNRLPPRGGGAFFGASTSSNNNKAAGFLDSLGSAVSEKFQEAVETGVPTQLSYGFIAGWCSGMALKRVGQTAATILGIGFVTLQTLQYYGYIEINHNKFKERIENAFDMNDDGKIDKTDFQQSFDKVMGVLTYNMPSGAGFVGGFLGGVRS